MFNWLTGILREKGLGVEGICDMDEGPDFKTYLPKVEPERKTTGSE